MFIHCSNISRGERKGVRRMSEVDLYDACYDYCRDECEFSEDPLECMDECMDRCIAGETYEEEQG